MVNEFNKSNRLLSNIIHFVVREGGYAIALTLIAMPLIMGLAVLVIDGSRVQNLHTDLQNAVDAMALSGARELDGRNDAISRAKSAIEGLNGNQAWFGGGGAGMNFGSRINVQYNASNAAASTVDIYFLKDIPDSDDTPLTGTVMAGLITTDPNDAKYLLVRAKPQAMVTMFPLPFTGRGSVNVAADAVAGYKAAACDVTPIYVCNPFEGRGIGSFNEQFEQGNLYGVQFKLMNTGSSSPGPGNFGFLRTYGTGANVLAEALAKGAPGVCYSQEGVDTEPGATVGPVIQGINTRMGLYGGSYSSAKNDQEYSPDKNIRMGQSNPETNASCSGYSPEQDPGEATPFPDGIAETPIGGGSYSNQVWDLAFYWDIAHGHHASNPYTNNPDYTPTTAVPDIPRVSYPPSGTTTTSVPSRYDVYNYEIANETLLADTSPNGETGLSHCHNTATVTPTAGRRVIFTAVINCIEKAAELQGAATDIQPETFALMFMTKPAIHDGSNNSISLEVTDVSGKGGRGTMENFLRQESVLVR